MKLTVFTAAWCKPCNVLKAQLEVWMRQYQAGNDGKYVILDYIDIDAQPEVAARYGVRSVPTVFLGTERLPNGVVGIMKALLAKLPKGGGGGQ